MIQLDSITKTYGNGAAAVDAVSGLSLTFDTGEFAAVMGPSGSGKSTLLAILGGMNTPSRGRYLMDGLDVYALPPDGRADFRSRSLGFVFQAAHLAPHLTLLENALLPLVIRRMPMDERRGRAARALDRVGLAGKENRLPSQVSGGEQGRAAVARALVADPPILLADEPTGHLDQATGRAVMELLVSLNQEGRTVILVTHNPEHAAMAPRQVNLADGRILSDNRPLLSRAA